MLAPVQFRTFYCYPKKWKLKYTNLFSHVDKEHRFMGFEKGILWTELT
jgi:hypothetical protein